MAPRVFCPSTILHPRGGSRSVYMPPVWRQAGDPLMSGRRAVSAPPVVLPSGPVSPDVIVRLIGETVADVLPTANPRSILVRSLWYQAVQQVPVLTPELVELFLAEGLEAELVHRTDCPTEVSAMHLRRRTAPLRLRAALASQGLMEPKAERALRARVRRAVFETAAPAWGRAALDALEALLVLGDPLSDAEWDTIFAVRHGSADEYWKALLLSDPRCPVRLLDQCANNPLIGTALGGTLMANPRAWDHETLGPDMAQMVEALGRFQGGVLPEHVDAAGCFEGADTEAYRAQWRRLAHGVPMLALLVLPVWRARWGLDLVPHLTPDDLAPLLASGDHATRLAALMLSGTISGASVDTPGAEPSARRPLPPSR